MEFLKVTLRPLCVPVNVTILFLKAHKCFDDTIPGVHQLKVVVLEICWSDPSITS